MRLTTEQAFKVGFLAACAEEGLTLAETHARVKQAIAQVKQGKNVVGLEKQAALPAIAAALGSLANSTMNVGKGVIGTVPGLLSTVGTIGVGAPVLAGAGGGYLAAKMVNNERKDVLEEAKQDEIVSEYERLAEEAKRRALLKRIQSETGRKIVPLSPSLSGS